MFKDRHYFAVGIFVILVAALGAYFVYWLSVAKEPENTRRYLVYFNDSVRGLSKGSQVRYMGVRVGRVQDVRISPDNPERIEVILDIRNDTPIRSNTQASVQMQGVTGLSFISLNQSDQPGTPLDYPAEGMPEISTTESGLERLFEAAPKLVDQVTALTNSVNRLFSDQNLGHITAILENAEKTSAQLQPTLAEMTAILQETREALKHINATAASLNRTTEELQPEIISTVDNIQQTSRNMAEATRQLQQLVANNQEGINDFVATGLPEFTLLIRESRAAARQIQDLAESLQRNPNQLIVPSNVERTEIAP